MDTENQGSPTEKELAGQFTMAIEGRHWEAIHRRIADLERELEARPSPDECEECQSRYEAELAECKRGDKLAMDCAVERGKHAQELQAELAKCRDALQALQAAVRDVLGALAAVNTESARLGWSDQPIVEGADSHYRDAKRAFYAAIDEMRLALSEGGE